MSKKVLIACEESQRVCLEFRKLGFMAYSCDLMDCSGGYPEWHIKDDVLNVIKHGLWEIMIAFPPCTYLSCAGNAYFQIEKYGYKSIDRWHKRIDAMKLFYDLWNAPIKHIAIENPMGFLNTVFRKPDQIIEPYYFGDNDKKRTCLWLKNLPKLMHNSSTNLFETKTHTEIPQPIYIDRITGKKRYKTDSLNGFNPLHKIERSKTFPGIAKAMAQQWSPLLNNEKLISIKYY